MTFWLRPLQRAVPVAEHRDLPGPVAENLDLHVPGVAHQPLEEDPRGGEVGGGEPLHPGERVGHLGRVVAGQHADAATATGRLDHDGVADLGGRRDGVRGAGKQAGRRPSARRCAHAARRASIAGGVLRAERLQDLRGGRADEGDALLSFHLAGEVGVL